MTEAHGTLYRAMPGDQRNAPVSLKEQWSEVRRLLKTGVEDIASAESPQPTDEPNRRPLYDSALRFLFFGVVAFLPWFQLFVLDRPNGNSLVLVWIWALAVLSFPSDALIVMLGATASEYLRGWAWFKVFRMTLKSLFLMLSAVLAAFAQTYYVLFGGAWNAFSPELTPVRAAFFTWGNFTTAGSGIVAKSPAAQLVTMLQMAVGLLIAFVILALLATFFREPFKQLIEHRRKRQNSVRGPASGDASQDATGA